MTSTALLIWRSGPLSTGSHNPPTPDEHIEACANCGSGEYLTNWDGNRNDYCGQCGQKIDWREEDDDNAEKPDL